MKLTHILKQLLKEQKKKADRCKRIANRKYDKPSAYKSGAIVRCRKGKIWKGIKEEITTAKPVEDSFLTKTLNSLSKFIKGEELINFFNKIKTVATFDNYILKFAKGNQGANQFIIDILDKENNNKVGKFVAFIFKDKETNKQNLQIQKVEIYPEYKGKGIMRKFYQEFNKWLKDNFDNFDKFTSDFIFLYNKDTGKYDGFNMWEDLVKKGLARRLGPDENYILPTTPPKDGMWRIKTGYALNENLTSIPIERVLKPNGAIGNQGVTTDQVKGILKNVLHLSVPENATMKEMVDLFKKDEKNIKDLLDFTKKNPIVILELPDGTISIKDGHHRAFLLHQAGIKELPVEEK